MPLNWPFARTRTHQCPDGSTKIVYRNVDDAFPLFIPGWQANITAAVVPPRAPNVHVAGQYASRIHGLLFALDELNQSLMMNFRGAYVAYSSDPCGNAGLLQRQVDYILREQHRVQMVRVQIQGLIALAESQPGNHEGVTELFQTIVHAIGGPATAEAADDEIRNARQIMDRWIERDHG